MFRGVQLQKVRSGQIDQTGGTQKQYWAHASEISTQYGRCRCLPVASGHRKATKELMHLIAHNAGADQSDWILQYPRLQLETGQPEVTRCLVFPAALMQDAFLGL